MFGDKLTASADTGLSPPLQSETDKGYARWCQAARDGAQQVLVEAAGVVVEVAPILTPRYPTEIPGWRFKLLILYYATTLYTELPERCALRPGLNPYEHSGKPCSYTGSSILRTAR